jgi:hypothetical protein
MYISTHQPMMQSGVDVGVYARRPETQPKRRHHNHSRKLHDHGGMTATATATATATGAGASASATAAAAAANTKGLTPSIVKAVTANDMPKLFGILEEKIEGKRQHLEGLKNTLDFMVKNPDLFQKDGLLKVATVFRQRVEEYELLCNNFQSFQHLYTTHIKDMETTVQRRADALKQVDKEFGSLSAEPELCNFFAEDQATLTLLVAQARDMLMEKIVHNLGAGVNKS